MATFEPKSALPDNVTDRGKVERIKLSGPGNSTEETEWVDVATQAELDAHTGDSSAAHAASAISFSATGSIAGTDVQTAVAEVATDAAAALSSHEADTTSVHGISDTSALLTTSSGIDALADVTITAAASGDILRHNGTAWVDAVGTTHFEAAGAVAAHEADTTSVHGIADTSVLVDGDGISSVVKLTQAAYDALTPDSATLYVISDGPVHPPAGTESSASFTLAADDDDVLIRCTNASQVTVTVPTNASVAIPVGFETVLYAEGAGGVTLSTTGVTLTGSPLKTISSDEALFLKKVATDTWIVLGGTST